MENNFDLILLDLVRRNKDKFLGLLRRNGVLVSPNTSNVNLTNMILGAMTKSESFKKEAIILMSVLTSGTDSNFTNMSGSSFSPSNPFSGLPTFDPNTFSTTGGTTTTTTTTAPKKDFADTTVGNITDKLFTLFDGYLKGKELDTRKAEANTVATTSNNQVTLQELNKEDSDKKSNVGLYVGLGIGGFVIVGALIYLIAKKK
jgi:hypothetical protein